MLRGIWLEKFTSILSVANIAMERQGKDKGESSEFFRVG